MSEKDETELLNKIAKSFQTCTENCEYHKQFSELKNKDEIFKVMQLVVKITLYHESHKLGISTEFKTSLIVLLNIFSTQYSIIEILDWLMDISLNISEQKKMN